jgi:DNA-binding MarR family transcriptional regulator
MLTPKGRRICDKASTAYVAGRERVLAHLDADEIEQIEAALRQLLGAFEADRLDSQRGDPR